MEQKEINLGDKVTLKSGGPPMTVIGKEKEDNVICAWFAGGQLKNHSFALASLRLTEEKKNVA